MISSLNSAIRQVSIITCLLFSINCMSQHNKSGEIGVSAGGTYYLGEFNKTPFVGTNISAGAFYRHTIDTRFAVTGSFYYGKLSGKEEKSDFMVSDGTEPAFKRSFFEISPVVEFNFLPFLPGKPNKYYYTPYVFAGLATAYYPKGDKPYILSMPFGMGAKFNINHRYLFGFFMGMRKTFLDAGDMLDYKYEPPNIDNATKQWGYKSNKDWYSIFGISLSYKINYRMKCPAFD